MMLRRHVLARCGIPDVNWPAVRMRLGHQRRNLLVVLSASTRPLVWQPAQ